MAFPLNKQISDTYRIQWYLGDASEINHISDGVSIYIGGGANASIRNSINATVYVSSCRNILLESFHNELGACAAAKIRYFSMSYIILLNNIRLFNFFVSVYYD